MGKKTPPSELLPGTLDLLILRVLVAGRMHGYGIAQRVKHLSGRSSRGGRKLAVSGAAAVAAERLGEGGVGYVGKQPPGAILHDHGGGRKQLVSERAEFDRVVGAILRVLESA